MKRKTTIKSLAAVAAALGAAAVMSCAEPPNTGGIDRDTLTRRQKDSIVSEMPLPGASAIKDLIESADSIQSRVDRHDSIG